jgi:hypothetical protein
LRTENEVIAAIVKSPFPKLIVERLGMASGRQHQVAVGNASQEHCATTPQKKTRRLEFGGGG